MSMIMSWILPIETETLIFMFIGTAILMGVLFERGLSKYKVPAILAYIFVGTMIGPTIHKDQLRTFDIINTLMLSLMGFHLGTEIRLHEIKKMGKSIVSIVLGESIITWIFVFVGTALLTKSVAMGLIFAALAVSTGPAGTVEVIKQCRAKGKFTSTLFAVMGLDDIVALLIFSVSMPIAKLLLMQETGGAGEHVIRYSMLHALMEIVLAVGIGSLTGYILCVVAKKIHDKTMMLLVAIGTLFFLCGLSEIFEISPVLLTICVGIMLGNRSGVITRKYNHIYNDWAPPIYLVFFALIGARIDILAIGSVWIFIIVYIVIRCIGKYLGTFIGAVIGKSDTKIKNYLGYTLFSQAGIALGLTFAAVRMLEETAKNAPHGISQKYTGFAEITAIVMTSTTFAILLFSPFLVKYGLKKAGEKKHELGE